MILRKNFFDLKSKLLQEVQVKQEMVKKGGVEIVLVASQPVDIEELTRSMSQVSLKDKDITTLKKENKYLEKAKKEYHDKNANLKYRLMGKLVLQSVQHSLLGSNCNKGD